MEIIVTSLANDPNYAKCPRCWHYTHEGIENYDGLCDRCCRVLADNFPDHPAVPHMKAAINAQCKKYCARPENETCPHLHCCRTIQQD